MHRIIVRNTGGPEVLEYEAFEAGEPGPGEVLLRHEAIGLNFIDTYLRTGLYPRRLPLVPGQEAAGVVEAVGEGVAGFRPGDRAGYAGSGPGAYASHRVIAASELVPLPDFISFETAAAVLLKGLTVAMLADHCARVKPGEHVLALAAAGGVGSMLVPWLKSRGAVVIAHSGSPEKAAIAAALGADHSLSCPFSELAETVRSLTGGKGVRAVFDGVGKDSFTASLDSIGLLGLMICYGNASGPAPAIAPLELSGRGSLFLTRPGMFHYMLDETMRKSMIDSLFEKLGDGTLNVRIGQTFPLSGAADAHRALEARQTTGATVLIP
ncbi:MAG: quinone oxidoreductase [Blastomonas sp.]